MNLPHAIPRFPNRTRAAAIAALASCTWLASHAADISPAPATSAPAISTPPTNTVAPSPSNTNATQTASAPVNGSRTSSTAATGANTNSFDRYRLLAERNIFNANRTRASRPSNGETKPAPKIEAFALAGVMIYQKGTFAFFDSSISDFKKSLKTGDTIAGYQIQDITPNQVTLKHDDQTVVLKPGQQLKREDGGAWQLVQSGDRLASSGTASSSPSSDTDSTEPSGPASDILKKLMERRAKELNP